MKKISTLFMLCVALLFSCRNSQQPVHNRDKLLTGLLQEYAAPGDSLQRQAAIFLITYMNEKKHIVDSSIAPYISTIHEYYRDEEVLAGKLDAIRKRGFDMSMVADSTTLTVAYLKKNIDNAFYAYHRSSWNGTVSFKNFCEYILPYKAEDEPLEYWRDSILKYNYYFKNIWIKPDILTACGDINRYLGSIKVAFNGKFGAANLNLPPLPNSSLELLSMGSCKEFSNQGLFMLRTAGMPVAKDFSPQHGNAYGGHEWLSLVRDSTNCVPFDIPSVWGLGIYKAVEVKNPKIYRCNYSVNPLSHAKKRGICPFLPDWFNNTCVTDVTAEYMPVSTVNLPIKNHQKQFVYLNCYDSKTWIPVSWTVANDTAASFEKMGREIVYLATTITKEKTEIVSLPFLLDTFGNIVYLKADTLHRQTMKLTRKFPLKSYITFFHSRMLKGVFQGANQADFSDAVDLFTITKMPGDSINSVKLPAPKSFRYLRYFSPKNSSGNIAELNFYDNHHHVLKGKIIGTEGSYLNVKSQRKEAAFDGDPVTFFDSGKLDSTWVGMAFDQPVNVQELDYRARSDNNGMNIGHDYELFYCGSDGKWHSAGRMKATGYELRFNGVPKNGVYYLHNHTTGKEERIFTYENNQQVWW